MNYWGNDYVMGHLLVAARCSGKAILKVDLLTASAEPVELLPAPVFGSVNAYCADFPSFLVRSGADLSFVRAAQMTVSYDLSQVRPAQSAPQFLESPFICSVEIIDDRGIQHTGSVSGWWYPEPASPQKLSLWRRLKSWFHRP